VVERALRRGRRIGDGEWSRLVFHIG
jgi:hypothetical protein